MNSVHAETAWLREARERIVRDWWAALSRRSFPPDRARGYQLLDALVERLDAPAAPGPSLPPVLETIYSLDEALVSLACLREATIGQMERDGLEPSHPLLGIMNAQLDQWMIGLSQTRHAQIQEALTALNRDLGQRLAEQSRSARDTMLRLESLERTKSDFISIAAHELKTPLTLIRGYASIVAEEARKLDVPRVGDLTQGILQGADRLGKLIDDLIDAATIDLDALELHRGPVFLGKLVTMAIAEVYAEAPGRHHRVSTYGLNELPTMEGDTQRLHQAFLQMIGNAMKFTPDGGRIDISGRLLYAGNGVEISPFVELLICDTGIGIAPQDCQLIFEKFYRTGELSLHSTSKARFKGAGPGLGLTIARGIIRAHGGTVWVESPGYDEARCPGACFHVILPTRAGPNASQTEALLHQGTLTPKDAAGDNSESAKE